MRPPTGRRLSTPVRRQLLGLLLVFSLTILALPQFAPFIPTASAASTELFFSEYVEGSSTNKALEIFNGTGAPVTLTGQYNIQMFFNGSATAGLTINLTGAIANNDVFVIVNQTGTTNPALVALADQTNGAGWFNGDDAVVLRKGTTIVDVIGQIGVDPGTEWGAGLTSTADNTLRRKSAISAGDTNGGDAFDPAVEWDGFVVDTFGDLGTHNVVVGDTAPSVANTSPAGGATNIPLNANITVTFSEPVNVSGSWFSISCGTSGSHTATVSGGATTFTLDPDSDFVGGETCTVTVLAGQVADQDVADPPDNMAANHVFSFSTVAGDPCASAFTPIYQIQGSGPVNTVNNTVVTTRGVVVGDFQGNAGLNGFFIQDGSGDGNVATSDGVFVFVPAANALSSVPVSVGDVVVVKGRAIEFNTLTEIDNVTVLTTCGTAPVPATTVVDLPETVNGELERVEGMLITIPETLTVAQNFFQGRFGQVTLAADGRLFNPTNSFLPNSPAAIAQADENARRLLVLDDGFGGQNPSPIPYIGADNTLRAGDTVAGLTGVIDFGSISSTTSIRDYRLHPTVAPTFSRDNPRTAAPDSVGGNVKVASFNVLNYFNGNGTGLAGAAGGFPTSRGADTLAEFNRQRDKIIAAISAIDADVVGLIEIENDGGGAASAIQDLVNGLNAVSGPGAYAPIVGPSPGTDEIQVAFIYKPARVTPVGAAVNHVNAVYQRQPLAQTFSSNQNGEKFTVVVNHLKSKSGCPTNPADPDADQGDGQGCFNAERVQQATALLGFISNIQASSGDPDVLVMGDLNAYGKEDPITTLTGGGLVDAIAAHIANPYSFVFDGMAGYLDHALATPSLASQVAGVTEWHINTDEPSVIDYNTEFKGPGFSPDLYTPTPYRSADHDPVVVGLNLNAPPTASAGGPYSVNEGGTVAVAATGTDPDADALTFDWDLDNDGNFETPGQTATFSAAGLDGPDTRTIKVRVTDAAGNFAVASATVSVANVAPAVGAIAATPAVVVLGGTVNTSAAFTDAGTPDTHTAVWNWGDSSTSAGVVSESNGSGTATGGHTYAAPGLYTVTVTVTDDDGGVGTSTTTVAVGYNVVALYDQAKAHNSGSTIPFRLQITDAAGNNLSSPGVVVQALGIAPVPDAPIGSLSPAPSNSDPDGVFRFGDGEYKFNLKTQKSWAAGTYYLYVQVGSDPNPHALAFQIR